jgi:CubicO group peptidase (beta-lactamase class C family)
MPMRGGATAGAYDRPVRPRGYGAPVPDAPLPAGVSGWCEARFARVATVLAEQLTSGAHRGAAVAIRHRGVPVADLWGGGFEEDTLVVSFSTTKGVVATAVHMVLERAGLSADTPMAQVWPEFGAAGKEQVTIRQCLSHEAGVPQIRDQVDDVWAMADWPAMVAMVAGLAPLWSPGTANGYHAINWGWLAGELVARVDGRPLGRFLADEVSGPLGLDGCFVGVRPEEERRLVPVFLDPSYRDMPPLENLLPPDSVTLRALSPRGDVVEFVNSEQGRRACVPALTGAFTARSLATIYAALERGGGLDGVRLLGRPALEAAVTVQNTRPDLVLFVPVGWRMGYMSMGDVAGLSVGDTAGSFGHAGLGGSLALADPRTELAIAVTLDHLHLNMLSDTRAGALVKAATASVLGG